MRSHLGKIILVPNNEIARMCAVFARIIFKAFNNQYSVGMASQNKHLLREDGEVQEGVEQALLSTSDL